MKTAADTPLDHIDLRKLLSERELQILLMFFRDYKNSDIAASLHISEKTIDTHRAHILEKVGMGPNGRRPGRGLYALHALAIRQGLASPRPDEDPEFYWFTVRCQAGGHKITYAGENRSVPYFEFEQQMKAKPVEEFRFCEQCARVTMQRLVGYCADPEVVATLCKAAA